MLKATDMLLSSADFWEVMSGAIQLMTFSKTSTTLQPIWYGGSPKSMNTTSSEDLSPVPRNLTTFPPAHEPVLGLISVIVGMCFRCPL